MSATMANTEPDWYLRLNASGNSQTHNCIDYGQYTWPQQVYYPYYVQTAEPPRECSGDVHVFPCPHCDKCKCGGATKAKAKR